MTTQTPAQDRLRWIDTDLPKIDDGSDVIQGLTQIPKTLPCKYFYDDSPEERLRQRGSELFEQITDLPEYYPTRTEQAILETYVSEIIALTGACEPIELGSGKALQPGEFFLLGVDLQKPIDIMEAAYNDAQGVTAAFNLNLLQHLNDRFDGNFNLDRFEHLAFFNPTASQIEMHLKSLSDRKVKLKALDLEISFKAGETIHTEISRKFNIPTLTDILANHALHPLKVWTDPQSWFGLVLCQRQ